MYTGHQDITSTSILPSSFPFSFLQSNNLLEFRRFQICGARPSDTGPLLLRGSPGVSPLEAAKPGPLLGKLRGSCERWGTVPTLSPKCLSQTLVSFPQLWTRVGKKTCLPAAKDLACEAVHGVLHQSHLLGQIPSEEHRWSGEAGSCPGSRNLNGEKETVVPIKPERTRQQHSRW